MIACTIDLLILLLITVAETGRGIEEGDLTSNTEHVRAVIEDCQKMLMGDNRDNHVLELLLTKGGLETKGTTMS